ncbi:protoporphyrinogen oxidase [Cryptococcus depauperatus]|nr:protoporphyrinogen oxidase [Cryptococcus depauperatus CBS 7855]
MSLLPKHITILGAGLTGLSTAYHLCHLLPSIRITILERSRAGGWIDSRKIPVGFKSEDGSLVEGEVVIESGPRTIRPRGSKGAASMLKMIHGIGLHNSIRPVTFSHPSAKNRFLLDISTSKLTALPSSALSLLGPQPPLLQGLLASCLVELFKRSGGPPRLTVDNDESVDSFFRRRFGDRIADNMASAMVHGIHAASSTQLSLRAAFPVLWEAEKQYGSATAGLLLGTKTKSQKAAEKQEWTELTKLGVDSKKWSLYGLEGGLGTIIDKLLDVVKRKNVEISLNERATKIEPTNHDLIVHTTHRSLSTSSIISALPTHQLSPLLPTSFPKLTYNPYTSVGVINIVYPLQPSQVHPAGFGYLIPHAPAGSVNPTGVLGVIFDSTVLPGNEFDSKVTKLTVMMGGPYWSTYEPHITPPIDAEELVHQAVEHLHTVFPHLRSYEPIFTQANLHQDCIPTYLPGHGSRLNELYSAIENSEWKGKLSLVGNAYGGVGVNDCVYSGREVARGLAEGKAVNGLEAWSNWQ